MKMVQKGTVYDRVREAVELRGDKFSWHDSLRLGEALDWIRDAGLKIVDMETETWYTRQKNAKAAKESGAP